MKVLWVNPSFLDYRVPVYSKLNELTGENFYLLYSKRRVPERVINKIESSIGDHAIGLVKEKILIIPGTGHSEDTRIRIPFQVGLNKAITSVDADIIIAEGFFQWTPMALLNAKLKKKKIVIAYERTAHTERKSPKWRVSYRKLLAKYIDGYSVNGQLTRDYLIQLGIDEGKIFLGGMSADSKNLIRSKNEFSNDQQEELKLKLSLRKGLTYLFVGRFIEIKGIIYLLNAWTKHLEKYPDDNLITIGEGPLLAQYKEEFANYDSIKILGAVDYDLIHAYYAIADVFVMPTLEDNWSLVVPEAMACGLPIASSIYNGCHPELVHENINGKLFDPLEEDSIIEALDYFHTMELEPMGQASMRIEKNYNTEAVANNIYKMCVELYEK